MTDILVLLKMITEPCLSITEHKDSLDIMNEMGMQELLKHPVVVEVINLVYESQYSVTHSPLALSASIESFLDDKTFDNKSIAGKLINNILTFGEEA